MMIALFGLPIFLYIFTNKYKKWWNVALIISFVPTFISSVFYIFGSYGWLLSNLHIGNIFWEC
jgi:hypothetical protein